MHSQVSIDAINNISSYSKKASKKFKNWILLYTIKELIVVQNINIQLVKVKVHSGIKYNELTDKLAKNNTLQSKCVPNILSLCLVNAVSHQSSELIEVPLRGFVKKMEMTKYTEVASLLYKKRFVTCDKETRERAFNMKLLNNELSTMECMFEISLGI
ncbi:hypothetical protein Glove_393g5 [Diversispora epigaea]|uniref:RNase H type-1 domain-containing protein n=1 Tax=Diversispora epigaea TaxID=1348612 RepID=A0A397H1U9_9GLOM|nr:hypothetical protein Glove_393g5 [Diversispora epigaea]